MGQEEDLFSDSEFDFEDIDADSEDSDFYGGVDWKALAAEDSD